MAQLANVKNVTKTVSNLFPRVNRTHFIESSLEHSWSDVYLPINNVDTDNFCEFRIPRSQGNLIDLSSLNLQFHFTVKKKIESAGIWSPFQKTSSGDHFEISNAIAFSLFKHLTIEFNGVQVTNESNYSLLSYIRLLTQFPVEEINKLGRLFHLEHYNKILQNISSDTYFTNLPTNSSVSKRLLSLRDNGVFVRAPLMTDICNINSYLLDNIDITIRLSLHEGSSIFITSQQQPDISSPNPKKYNYDISNISLHVKKVKPSDNAYTALQKTLIPKLNDIPTLDYIFTSKVTKQFHLPSGQNGKYIFIVNLFYIFMYI